MRILNLGCRKDFKNILSVFACAIFAFSFFSCTTTDENERIHAAINYGEEDVVKDEIKAVERLLEKKPVEALWRSSVLVRNAPGGAGVSEIFEKCEEKAASLYDSFLEEKKYIDAKRIYDSLSAVESKKIAELKNARTLETLVNSSVPSMEKSSGNEKVSTMINGTVTIYVDRGIKVESGVGYKDTVLGSGFFISKNGHIVTNYHVISSCVDPAYNGYAKLMITLAGDADTKIPARVVGYDKTLDLALLKTEVDAPYVFELGSSSSLDIGDRIFVIGSPLGLDRTLTSGIVSATDRDLLSLGKVFQIDAAVSPGNSGGPMIDAQGRVCAVVFAGVQNYQGLNFAIPVEYLKAELSVMFAGGKKIHGWMEAFGKTKRTAGAGARNCGVEVLYVMPGGKLGFSGIKAGESITALDGKAVSSLDDLHLYLLGKQGDSIIRVTVTEEDESGKSASKTYPVYLSQRPDNPGYVFYMNDLISSALYPVAGMELVRSSVSDKRLYSIKKVLKNSAADSAGFSEGDPVRIISCELSEDKSALSVLLYANKKKNGFLDYGMSLAAPLDGSQYF